MPRTGRPQEASLGKVNLRQNWWTSWCDYTCCLLTQSGIPGLHYPQNSTWRSLSPPSDATWESTRIEWLSLRSRAHGTSASTESRCVRSSKMTWLLSLTFLTHPCKSIWTHWSLGLLLAHFQRCCPCLSELRRVVPWWLPHGIWCRGPWLWIPVESRAWLWHRRIWNLWPDFRIHQAPSRARSCSSSMLIHLSL